jgi:hypothetical protein
LKKSRLFVMTLCLLFCRIYWIEVRRRAGAGFSYVGCLRASLPSTLSSNAIKAPFHCWIGASTQRGVGVGPPPMASMSSASAQGRRLVKPPGMSPSRAVEDQNLALRPTLK